MKLLVLHLTDLHFDAAGTNEALWRAENLARAIAGNYPVIDSILVAITGDVVDRGEQGAYDLALSFFQDFERQIHTLTPEKVNVFFAVTPGNHDLVRPGDEPSSYSHLKAWTDLTNSMQPVTPSDVKVKICLSQQDAFFDFAEKLTGMNFTSPESRLATSYRLDCRDVIIRVLAINTALLCRDSVDQGKLKAWIDDDSKPQESSSLNIILLHHPFAWLERTNAKTIERQTTKFADLVFSGHEHEADEFVKHSAADDSHAYYEGEAFTGSKGGFSCVLVDTEQQTRRHTFFEWRSNLYSPTKDSGPFQLRRGIGGPSDGLYFTKEYEEFLDDAGLPGNGNGTRIRMQDIFVYPRLLDVSLSENVATTATVDSHPPHEMASQGSSASTKSTALTIAETPISAKEISERITELKRIVILGGNRSGKSTLMKQYVRELRAAGFLPILLKPSDCQSCDEHKLQSALQLRIEEQYGKEAIQTFLQLEANKKVLLLDEMDSLQHTTSALQNLLRTLSSFASHSIFSCDELYLLKQIWVSFRDTSADSYRMFRILDLDPRQRREYAAKMQRAFETAQDEDELGAKIEQLDQNITSVLGNQIITPTVGEVKSIVWELVSKSSVGTTQGAYGFYYDSQIKSDIKYGIKSCPRDVLEPQADAIEAFLAELAITLFNRRLVYFHDHDIDSLITEFRERKIILDKSSMLKILLESRLLVKKTEGYCFRERYQRYYFTAKKLEYMIGADSTVSSAREILTALVRSIHERESADIVLFTVYLTSSQWLLTMLAERSESIFSGRHECDMNDWDDLGSEGMDLIDFTSPELPEDAPESGLVPTHQMEAKELDDLMESTVKEMSEAYNVISILGIAVKNYSARIELDLRVRMVENGYALSLRSLEAFVYLIRQGSHELDTLARRHLKLKLPNQQKTKFTESSQSQYGMLLASTCGFGVIRRVTFAFASPHVSALLKDVWIADARVSAKLIRFSSMLDLRQFGTDQTKTLYSSLNSNSAAQLVMKYLVTDHLRRYRSNHSRISGLCGAVKIASNNPIFYYDPARQRSISP